MKDDSKFTFDVLEGIQGETIDVYILGTTKKITELKVEKVERSSTHGERFDAFSVQLSGSNEIDQHCGQGTYTMKHPAFDEEYVFMTPNAQDSYHVCVSRENAKAS